MRVISSPSSSTTGLATLILAIDGLVLRNGIGRKGRRALPVMLYPERARQTMVNARINAQVGTRLSGTDRSKPDLSARGGRRAQADDRPRRDAARREYRRGRARDGEFRLVGPAPGAPARRLAEREGAGRRLGRARSSSQGVKVFEDERAAVADCPRVYATSARPRELAKPVMTPERAAAEIRALRARAARARRFFSAASAPASPMIRSRSPMRSSRCRSIRGFASLNLAQAVLILAYEWFKLRARRPSPSSCRSDARSLPAARRFTICSIIWKRSSSAAGFFFPPEKTPHMVRNIRYRSLARAA